MTRSDVRICAAWRDRHDRPIYTLADICPDCGGDAVNSAPAPFDPADPHGEHRRALKRRGRE